MTATAFVNWLSTNIINPLLYIIFAAALLVFIWGIIEFIAGLSSGTDEKAEGGKRHMLWGLAGLFIIVTTYSIISLVVNTFAPGCFPPQGTNCSQYYQPGPGQ